RFDFTHFEKVTASQLAQIEEMVNQQIAQAVEVVTDLMDLDKAKNSGAMALFDEKYDDVVRVVSMGDFSKELCGGTHVANTSEIGLFKIVSEESIGSGIRRITSKTSLGAYRETLAQQRMLEEAAADLKVTSLGAVNEKIRNLIQDNSLLNKTISELKSKLSAAEGDEMLNKAVEKDGLKFLIAQVDNDNSELKPLADQLISKLHEGVVLVYNDRDNKQMFVSSCSDKAVEKGYRAGDIIKTVCAVCGGNGGGRPTMATGGGKDSGKIAEAIRTLKESLGL
ncbi:MAG: alanine--tRNA ligase, partial [Erysipelotrichaceae bacterium]|nr:alanine--tRNA ligase [Erysipelotrichaceae bacterium]